MASNDAAANEQATALGAGKEVLHFFYDLTSVEQVKREDAAVHLAQAMHKSQKNNDGTTMFDNGAGAAKKASGTLRGCSPLTVYAMKRLLRGLGSSHDAARQGFGLALSAALAKVPEVESLPALDMLDEALQVSKSTKGSDARDALLGRIFGYSAFAQAGRAVDNTVADRLVASLIAVTGRKSFLREAAANALVTCLEALPTATLKHVLSSSEPLQGVLTRKPEEATPEDLLLALRLWPYMPSDLLSECPLLPRNCPVPSLGAYSGLQDVKSASTAGAAFMTSSHLSSVSSALAEGSASHPRVHSVWLTLLTLLIPGFTPVKGDEGARSERGEVSSSALQALWGWVDGNLLRSSHDRKYLAFQLFTLILPSVRSEHIPFLLTPTFLRVLVNSFSKADTHLHSAARRLIEQLARHAESSPDATLRVAAAVALQRQRGGGFDRLTKTKYASNLLKGLDEAGLQAYSGHLQKDFLRPDVSSGKQPQEDADAGSDEDMDDGETEDHGPAPEDAARRWAIEQLSGGPMLTKGSPATRLATLHFLARQAFFADKAAAPQAASEKADCEVKCEPPLSEAVRQLCCARLIAGVDTASKAPPPPSEMNAAVGTGQAAEAEQTNGKGQATHRNRPDDAILADVTRYVADLQNSQGVAIAAELPEELLQAVDSLRSFSDRATKAAKKSDAPDLAAKHRAFAVLGRWLQLYMLGDPESAEAELADELAGIYRDALPSARGKKAGKKNEAESPWMDRLVDVLLSLLAKSSPHLPSAPLRDAVEGLFRVFASHLTVTGMEDLLRVISTPDKGTEGEEGIFDYEEEVSEDEAESVEDEDEDDSEADGNEEDGVAAIDAATAAARPAGAPADEDDEATTSGSEDDDEAMEASGMDAKIAAVLRATADAKESSRRQKEAMAQLRFRVAALLELYGRSQPDPDLLMTALPALLGALRRALHAGPAQLPLAQRLTGLISKLSKARAAGKINEETGSAALKRLLYLTSRSDSKALGQAASGALMFGVRHASDSQAAQVVCDALKDFFTKKKTRLSVNLMKALLKETPSRQAAEALMGFHGTARNVFLKAEAVQLLQGLMHPSKEHQASVGADISTLQSQLADLVQQVISDAGEADAKPQRRADALSAAAGTIEALQRLLPASGQPARQPVLDGRAGKLAEAAAQQLAGLGPTSGKVGNQLKRLGHVLRNAAGRPKAAEDDKQQHQGPELANSGAEDASAKQQKRKAASSNGEMPRKAKGSKKKQKA